MSVMHNLNQLSLNNCQTVIMIQSWLKMGSVHFTRNGGGGTLDSKKKGLTETTV